MKARIASLGVWAATVLWPGWVFAAEGEPAKGSWSALIFYAVNFLIFLWIVRQYGWPYITQFFHDRSSTIREIRGRAEKAYQEAQELATRAAQELQQLEAYKRKMMSELDEETAYQVRQVNEAAGEAINRIRRDTEVTRAALRDAAQRRLRETMAEAAGRLAHEIISRNLRASDQTRLLQGFIDRIGEEAHP